MSNNKTNLDLKTDLQDWLLPMGGSENIASRIPDFISLAEELHTYGDPQSDQPGIRVREMLKRARAVGSDTEYLALPDGYLEMLNFRIVKKPGGKLDQVPHESLDRETAGEPTQFAVGREIEFDTILPNTSEVEMLYYSPFTPLSADADTNWLLNNCYSAYLYGSLIHAAPYLAADDRVDTWSQMYSTAVIRLQGTENRGRRHKGQLKVTMPQGMSNP